MLLVLIDVRVKNEYRRRSWNGVVGWYMFIDLLYFGWIIVVNYNESIFYIIRKVNKIY